MRPSFSLIRWKSAEKSNLLISCENKRSRGPFTLHGLRLMYYEDEGQCTMEDEWLLKAGPDRVKGS